MKRKSNMRIFITGSTGFVGRHVSRLLAERGHELMLLVRGGEAYSELEHVSPVRGDLSNMEEWKGELADFAPDAAVHLAWEGLPDYSEEMCRRNLEYGINLFEVAAGAGCKCILSIGSCWEYKDRGGVLGEESLLELSRYFGAAKNSLRASGEEICREYGISFYWPRLFYVYGPGQRNTSLVPHIIESFQNGVEPAIKSPGNRNDFIYVKDVAEAIACLIETRPGNVVYNVGSGRSTSVGDVIAEVRDIMGVQFGVAGSRVGSAISEGEDFWADISRMEHDCEWRPGYGLTGGLKETVESYVRGAVEMETE